MTNTHGAIAMNVPIGRKCEVINCGGVAVAKGLCDKHRKRLARHNKIDESYGRVTIDGKNLQDHPMYGVWRTITRVSMGEKVCGKWRDFKGFIEDVPSKPEGDFFFSRMGGRGLYEPGNVYWREVSRNEAAKKSRREYMQEYNKRKRKANPSYFKNLQLKKMYGITIDDWQRMYDEQGGVCKICGQPEDKIDSRHGIVRSLSVDHCHEIDKVRGLLCSDCNTAIGLFKHSKLLLTAAIEYCRAT